MKHAGEIWSAFIGALFGPKLALMILDASVDFAVKIIVAFLMGAAGAAGGYLAKKGLDLLFKRIRKQPKTNQKQQK